MRRHKSADDIAETISKALRREKDGVLEAPPGSRVAIFFDDVHLAEEVRDYRSIGSVEPAHFFI